MSDKNLLLELADRCEAEEPSRELDCRIWAATNDRAFRVHEGEMQVKDVTGWFTVGWIDGKHSYTHECSFVTKATTSLDAAVTLVPERLSWEVRRSGFGNPSQADIGDPMQSPPNSMARVSINRGVPAALALCAAALRARAASEGQKDG